MDPQTTIYQLSDVPNYHLVEFFIEYRRAEFECRAPIQHVGDMMAQLLANSQFT